MLNEYLIERVKTVEAFDVDAEKTRCEAEVKEAGDGALYPRLCGVLQYFLGEATKAARAVADELLTVSRRKEALEWAAECVLKGEEVCSDGAEVYEILYAAADVVEQAFKDGWNTEKLARRLRKIGIQDDEMAAGRFIDEDERCKGCGEFVGEEERCEECQENYDDAQKEVTV